VGRQSSNNIKKPECHLNLQSKENKQKKKEQKQKKKEKKSK